VYYSTPFFGGCRQFRYGFGYRAVPRFHAPGRFGHGHEFSAHPFPRHQAFRR
jgi:hypothetical protein